MTTTTGHAGALETLVTLGLTPTQARVYLTLLADGAATGYAVARSSGLARANVYQALSVLVQRGLASRHDAPGGVYRATPPEAAVALFAAQQAAALERLDEAIRREVGGGLVLERFEGDRAARAIGERLGGRAAIVLRGAVPPRVAEGLRPTQRGLEERGVRVELRSADAALAVMLVDRSWALVWVPGGAGMWSNDPLLIRIAENLLDR